jgi:hypothetical protein
MLVWLYSEKHPSKVSKFAEMDKWCTYANAETCLDGTENEVKKKEKYDHDRIYLYQLFVCNLLF